MLPHGSFSKGLLKQECQNTHFLKDTNPEEKAPNAREPVENREGSTPYRQRRNEERTITSGHCTCTLSTPQSYMVPVEIKGTPLMMELDTGETVSLISKHTWSEVLHSPEMQPSSIKLQSYPNRSLPVLGYCTVDIKIQNNNAVKLPLIVVEGQGHSLFGRNWLEQVKLDWSEIA